MMLDHARAGFVEESPSREAHARWPAVARLADALRVGRGALRQPDTRTLPFRVVDHGVSAPILQSQYGNHLAGFSSAERFSLSCARATTVLGLEHFVQ